VGEHRNKPVPLIGAKAIRVYEHSEEGRLVLQMRQCRFNSDGTVWSVEDGPVVMQAATGDDLLALLNECGKALMQPSILPSDIPPVVRMLS